MHRLRHLHLPLRGWFPLFALFASVSGQVQYDMQLELHPSALHENDRFLQLLALPHRVDIPCEQESDRLRLKYCRTDFDTRLAIDFFDAVILK